MACTANYLRGEHPAESPAGRGRSTECTPHGAGRVGRQSGSMELIHTDLGVKCHRQLPANAL